MKYKIWWFAASISFFLVISGIWSYYQSIDLQNQYNHIKNKLTEAEQIYSLMGLHQLAIAPYLFFGASIIMGIFGIVGFFWFDREPKLRIKNEVEHHD